MVKTIPHFVSKYFYKTIICLIINHTITNSSMIGTVSPFFNPKPLIMEPIIAN